MLISPEPWDHIFISKHHYAIHLGKRGNKVFFLNPPSKEDALLQTTYENVFSITYKGFLTGLRFLPSFLKKIFIKEKFLSLQKLCSVKFDIVWTFDNSVFFDFSALPSEVLKINHVVDLNQDFQTEKAATTADFCFCTTEQIKNRLLRYNSKVFKVNHGFNNIISTFASVILPGKSKIKALYTGNLAIPYIDWNLIKRIVIENPNIDFILIGPGQDDTSIKEYYHQLSQRDNCFFIGKVNAEELQSYYARADLLLICYKQESQSDQVANPHKVMEYLGSGKMIVATYTGEYINLCNANLMLMCERNDEFMGIFQKALNELIIWNSNERQQLRKAFALDNTYEKQLQRIESVIKIE